VITVLIFAIMLVAPTSMAPVTEGASLKEQIAAARQRQAKLDKSISNSQKLVKDLQRDQESTRNAISATKDDISDTRSDINATRERIKKVKARLERLAEKHAQLVEAQRQTDHTLGLLEDELAAGEIDLKARRESFQRRLAEAYRSDNTSLLDQVFTAESFSDVLTDTSAYLSYGEQDAQLAAEIVEDQQALDSLRLLTTTTRLQTDQLRRNTLDTQEIVRELRADLKRTEKRLEKKEQRLEKLYEAQKNRLYAIYKNKKQLQRAISKQRAQKAALQRSIRAKLAAANRRASAGPGSFGVRAGSGGGRMVWPTTGNVTQPYGCTGYGANPPRAGCAHFHDGIDIANRSGTPIVAAASGVVAYVGYNQWEAVPAWIIIVAHGGGVSTLYAHMQPRSTVRVGQTVKRGQLIAYMGTTGRTTGSHLHFEVWRGDWSPVSPYTYL
jgi:murein DD-endopeptidase MepM/ murein hydrolase activator NlpD